MQDGQLSLSDRAFQILGYFNADGQPIRQTGRDPVTGDPVSFLPSQKLDSVTIQSLLNMSSGLPQNVPVESSTFPVPPGKTHLFARDLHSGKLRALGYSSAPPYKTPASVYQQLSYYVYTFSTNRLALLDPGTYAYNDTGYALLGAVVATVSEQYDHLPYNSFLKQDILEPLGISGPLLKPPPNTPMAVIARTAQSHGIPRRCSTTPTQASRPRQAFSPTPKRPSLRLRQEACSPALRRRALLAEPLRRRGHHGQSSRVAHVVRPALRGVQRR